jgi:malonyl-CoA/methylmalonyl-CoA synthetase
MLPLIKRAEKFSSQVAVIAKGKSFTYGQLLDESGQFSNCLLGRETDLHEKRVAFAVSPGFEYVKVQWAIWRVGGIAVPLNPKAPLLSHEYVLKDAEVACLVIDPDLRSTFEPLSGELNIQLVTTDAKGKNNGVLADIGIDRRAMILYTSGTTGSPKGVVTTHANIQAQIESLITSWAWSGSDHIINVLPLHHVHGIINVVSCALWSGAVCEFMAPFDEKKLMDRFCSGDITLFMAVPTIYFKLVSYFESLQEEHQKEISKALKKMRLMVSGSAALPVSVLEKWQAISGHVLLERYGMTEIGMAISNPYEGTRVPGHIGKPLPKVAVRLVDDNGNEASADQQGEILIKGPAVFKEYWGRPEATRDTFTNDGWFKTGDIAVVNDGNFKIIGRSSVDIIKSGGYKISALEIEEVLREYSCVTDCAVVGIPDEEWGEIIAAGLILETGTLDENHLKAWLAKRLTGYQIPRIIKVLPDLPRNGLRLS